MTNDKFINVYNRFDNVFVKGSGTRVWDSKGNEFLDFVSGVAVNCLGHCHSVISNTLKEQGEKLIHISNLYNSEKQNELAEKLVKLGSHDKVFFCNSGTEAVETALKIARKYGKVNGNDEKNQIIYMKNSFHGRTLGALSVTGQKKYQKDFKPILPGCIECEFNNIEDLKKKINSNTCAIILEPVQGEGGLVEIEKGFLQKAKELCDKFNAILIFDEVQCGVGRMGTFFAYETFDIVPDVICMAKGLGGGFPIGAVLAKECVGKILKPGDHGNTFGGNPLGCAVSIAVIDELINKNIINEVKKKSKYIKEKFENLQKKHKCILEIRGVGLLCGVKTNINTKLVIKEAFDKGLLLVGAGDNVVRFLPPLNVSYKDIDEAINIFDKVINTIMHG